MAMRPFGELTDPRDALERLLAAAPRVTEREDAPLARAAGRVLARQLLAPIDVPGFARSAMDGYAVRAADTRGAPVTLSLVAAAAHAGPARRPPRVVPGACAHVATGAPIPEGADAVVPVEWTTPAPVEGAVTVARAVRPGHEVRPRGHDAARGERVLPAGAVLGPAELGLAAALGLATLDVWRRPRVAVMASGDELVPPGRRRLGPGEIHESNSFALAPALEAWGAEVRRLAPARDALPALRDAIGRAAADADLVVVTGGSSVGEKDLLRDAVKALRGRVLVHGIALRPGKPLLVARLPRGRLLVGLPGNPASALVNAHLFLAPAVRWMGRLPPPVPRVVRAAMAEDVAAPRERAFVLPVRVEDGKAYPTFKDSGAITSLVGSQGYVALDAGEARRAGDEVDVRLWW